MRIAKFCFLAISLIIFCNLNGVAHLFFNISAPFSPLLLLFCLALLISLRNIPLGHLTFSGKVFSAFFILFLIIGSIVPFFYSYYEAEYLELLRTYLSSILVILVFYKYIMFSYYKNRLEETLQIILTFLFVACILTLIAEATGIQDYGSYKAGTVRSSGVFANPNEAGIQANFSLIFLLSIFHISKNRVVQFFLVVGIAISIYCAFITYSKSSIILSAIIFIIYNLISFLSISNKKKNFPWFSIISLTLFIILISSGIGNFYEEYQKQLHPNQQRRLDELEMIIAGNIDEETTGSRTGLAEYAFELISERPATGYGLGTFQKLPGRGLGVHNTYLMIWGEVGILPILIFALFYLSTIGEAFSLKNLSHKFLILSILLIIFSHGLVSHNILDDRTINAMLGLIFALLKINQLKCAE